MPRSEQSAENTEKKDEIGRKPRREDGNAGREEGRGETMMSLVGDVLS